MNTSTTVSTFLFVTHVYHNPIQHLLCLFKKRGVERSLSESEIAWHPTCNVLSKQVVRPMEFWIFTAVGNLHEIEFVTIPGYAPQGAVHLDHHKKMSVLRDDKKWNYSFCN